MIRGAHSSTGAPASSIDACVETAKRYCARPSWISRATRARSSATARPNSANWIARQAPIEEDDEREHAQEVALRHERAREQRLEDEMQRREEHQREAEREPAREVVAAAHEAHAPADDRDERHERLERERAGEIERLLVVRRAESRERRAERAQKRPGDEEA